jgi:hypothetical protein
MALRVTKGLREKGCSPYILKKWVFNFGFGFFIVKCADFIGFFLKNGGLGAFF